MRSIRFSLILYFLLLLAIALGGVSWLGYHYTFQALHAKEVKTRELLEKQYQQSSQEIGAEFDKECQRHRESYERSVERLREDFDKDLRDRARPLAQRAIWIQHQPELLHSLGLINANLNFQGQMQIPLWLMETFPPFPKELNFRSPPSLNIWRNFFAPFDVRLVPLGFEEYPFDEIAEDSFVSKGEYYQINNSLGRVTDRSPNMGDHVFPFRLFEKDWRKYEQGFFDDAEIMGQKVRRVILRIEVNQSQKGYMIPPRPKAPKKGAPLPSSGKGYRPFVYLQFGSETAGLDKQIGNEKLSLATKISLGKEAVEESRLKLTQKHEMALGQLQKDTQEALAGLRKRILLIAFCSFAALVVGGFWLIRLGLAPLSRLSEAVSKVSAKDFRLDIDAARLPKELQPIVGRLEQTLEQLKKAFVWEKQSAADISHELRTPLAALMTNIELALRKPRSSEDYRQILEECQASAEQMNRLVESLLALARLDAGTNQFRPRNIDVADLAHQCADLVRPLAEARGLKLQVQAQTPLPLHTDPEKLREILTNLLHNAIEYNKPEGSVDLAVHRHNGEVHLEIRDTGIGIPKEFHDRIFERFFRVDPSRFAESPHSGLGLSIVKSYLELMGGHISVESNGRGSVFHVSVPAQETSIKKG